MKRSNPSREPCLGLVQVKAKDKSDMNAEEKMAAQVLTLYKRTYTPTPTYLKWEAGVQLL